MEGAPQEEDSDEVAFILRKKGYKADDYGATHKQVLSKAGPLCDQLDGRDPVKEPDNIVIVRKIDENKVESPG